MPSRFLRDARDSSHAIAEARSRSSVAVSRTTEVGLDLDSRFAFDARLVASCSFADAGVVIRFGNCTGTTEATEATELAGAGFLRGVRGFRGSSGLFFSS